MSTSFEMGVHRDVAMCRYEYLVSQEPTTAKAPSHLRHGRQQHNQQKRCSSPYYLPASVLGLLRQRKVRAAIHFVTLE